MSDPLFFNLFPLTNIMLWLAFMSAVIGLLVLLVWYSGKTQYGTKR